MRALVIAEYGGNSLKNTTFTTITAVQQLTSDFDIIVIGAHASSNIDSLKKIDGVKKILVAESDELKYTTAEQMVAILHPLVKNYEAILTTATTFGKNFLARLAAINDVGQISDVLAIKSPDTFVRPIYAGNILTTVQSLDPIKFLTIRPTAFSAAQPGNNNASVEMVSLPDLTSPAKVIQYHETKSDRPELTGARVVVSGGRGLMSADNFKILEELALKLNAAIGASRAAVDAGYVPNDYQVGQTGKVVAPELYIAIGISGAIQHLAGMKDSKVIVAINKDPDAPIFQIADYGLVGDLFDIVPELIKAIK